MIYLAILLGTIAGSAHDPVFWGCLAVAATIPFFGKSWPIYLLVASLIASLIRIGIAGSNRSAMGFPIDGTIIWGGAAVFLSMIVLALAVFLVRKILRPS